MARRIGEDYTLILMACNDSSEEMDRIIADKAYHEECRDCLNNPKTMRQEPAWFRVGLKSIPKDFIIPELQEVGASDQTQMTRLYKYVSTSTRLSVEGI
jgi:predicted RNA-binding protein with PUA-like domain